jgi:hypothetical protein
MMTEDQKALREAVARVLETWASDGFFRQADAAVAVVLGAVLTEIKVWEKERVRRPCPDGVKGCAVFHYSEFERPRNPLEIEAAIRNLIPKEK